MKLIKQSFEITEQPLGLEGIYKQIELIGRVCTKSEDKITENSAKEFVDKMTKLDHGAVLEHGTIYLFIPLHCDKTDYHIAKWYYSNPYSRVNVRNEHYCFDSNGYYITTNLRVLVENNLIEHLKFICEPTEYHEKRVCVKFICDRGVSHEFVRHRHFSFMQESTRYCNYSSNKFGNEITFIMPCWIPYKEGEYSIGEYEDGWGNYAGNYIKLNGDYVEEHDPDYKNFLYPFIQFLNESEKSYFRLLNKGWKPQQARAVLPNALKTELYMTGFISDWKHFFELRSNKYGKGGVHPQADELATPLYEEFKKRGYI